MSDFVWFMRRLPNDIIQIVNEFHSVKKTIDEYHEKKFRAYVMFYFSQLPDEFIKFSVPELHQTMHDVAIRAQIRYLIIKHYGTLPGFENLGIQYLRQGGS